MSASSGKISATTRTLLGLLALYSVTNFVLFVGSLVAWKRAKSEASDVDCQVAGIHCGFTAWGIYPLQAAAGLTSSFVAVVMFTHGLLRTMNTRLDPLYVFRGVFFTLLTLAPIVVVGWSSLGFMSFGVGQDLEGKLSSAPSPINATGSPDPKINSKDWLWDIVSLMSIPSHQFVGLGGAFILPKLVSVAGTGFAITMVHFNIFFGAAICGLAVALAPPASVLVGVHGVAPGGV